MLPLPFERAFVRAALRRSASSCLAFAACLVGLLAGLAGCSSPPSAAQLPQELTLYNWEGDIPQSVLDAFTQETQVKVSYQVYESQEDAIQNMRAGKRYDVVIMESRFIPLLVGENLLAELDYQNIPNFKNIAPNFRGLLYDPDNRHAIPYSWGVTGLLVRTDLAGGAVTRWSDLWDPRYTGKVAIWRGQPREVLALTLKSLGFSANSEKPDEVEAALQRLQALKKGLHFIEDYSMDSAAAALASGQVTIAMGYSGDLAASRAESLPVEFVLPGEGAVLWGDTFIVPANSQNKPLAESFINYLLRPEVSAQIVNQKGYASANAADHPFIEPSILNDPSIYPGENDLKKAEIILPLSAAGQALYDDAWQRFMDAGNP